MTRQIKLGIPKGSLENATIDLFNNAGWKITVSSRNYFPMIDDGEVVCSLIRAQEMARYIESGVLDLGLTGLDWILENDADVTIVSDLVYSKSSTRKAVVLGSTVTSFNVAEDSPVWKLGDLQGKKIFTELVNFTERYFKERDIPVKVEFSWGATEAKVVEGLVDAIVEVTETGSTLKAHGLKIIDTLLETNTKLVANKKSMEDEWKRNKIAQIAQLLRGALNAEKMVGLKMNVPKQILDQVVAAIPSLTSPTIAALHNSEWLSVETVIDESIAREVIPQLIRIGADGIIEYPLNKVVNKKDV